MILALLAAFYINEPVANLYETTSEYSRVVSQALISEEISILSNEENWSFIQTSDLYTGWIRSEKILKDEKFAPTARVCCPCAHVYANKDIKYVPLFSLPYGIELEVKETDERWASVSLPNGLNGFMLKAAIEFKNELLNKQDLALLGLKFLGIPYTWGGRSSFGYDCSGFTQMLYHEIGIDLPRDSRQQVIDPRFKTITEDELEKGDLIFFGTSERILHVGLYVGEGKFIHTCAKEQPWIKMSSLSESNWNGNPSTDSYQRVFRQLIK